MRKLPVNVIANGGKGHRVGEPAVTVSQQLQSQATRSSIACGARVRRADHGGGSGEGEHEGGSDAPSYVKTINSAGVSPADFSRCAWPPTDGHCGDASDEANPTL